MPAAPTPEDTPSLTEVRSTVEAVGRFKRAFATYRLYGIGHERSDEMEDEVFEALSAFLEGREDLFLVLSPEAILWRGQRVLEDDRDEESITRPLFADGVESIAIYPEVQQDELIEYLRIWYDAIARVIDTEHSFSTLVWEEDFPNIATNFQPGLIEDDLSEADKEARRGRLNAIVNSISKSDRLPKSRSDRRYVVSPAALAAMTHVEAFKKVDAKSLKRQARSTRLPANELSTSDRTSLATGVTSARGQAQRTLYALWQLFPPATASQRAEIVDFSRRITGSLVADGRSYDVARALSRIGDAARGTPRSERYLGEFCTSLSDEAMLTHLVKSVEDPAASEHALALLNLVPSEDVDLLFDPISSLPSNVRAKLVPILASKRPSPESLAQWLVFSGPASADIVFDLAAALDETHLDMVMRVGLIHDAEEVRLHAVNLVRPDRVTTFWSLLTECLHDPSNEIRQLLLQVIVRARDPRATEVLASQARSDATPISVALTAVRGLGALGGSEANETLRAVLQEHKNRDVRAGAALALANIADKASVKLLKSEGRKLLIDRVVKEACQEAIRRLRVRLGDENAVD